MTTLQGAVSMTATARMVVGTEWAPGDTITTYPSFSTIPGPTLSPGTHVAPSYGISPLVTAVSAVAMAGDSSFVAGASHTTTEAATLSGVATLSETAYRTQFPVATMAGNSTLTDQPKVDYHSSATLAANSVLTMAPRAVALSATTFGATATLTATMLQRTFGQVALSGTASLSLSPIVQLAGTASSSMNAVATLSSAVAHAAVVTTTFAPMTTLTASGMTTATVALALAGDTQLALGPVDIALSSSAWSATASLSVSTSALAVGAATFAANTTLTDSGMTVGFASTTFGAVGLFLTDLRKVFQADPFTMSATASFGPSVLTIVKVGVATFAATTSLTVLAPDVHPLRPPGFVPGPLRPVDKTPIWHLYVADTITGRVSYELPMTTMQWQSRLNDIGTAQATLDVQQTYDFLSDHDERDPRVVFRQFLSGAFRYSLCFAYGDTAVWAGPYTPGSIPGNSATVTVGASEFPYMFTKRILTGNRSMPVNPANTDGNVYLGPTTKSDIALSLIELATSGPPSYGLPWACPNPPPTNGGESRAYYGYDFATVWDQLSLLSSESDGPDIRFDPQLNWRSDGLYLNYNLQIGTPLLGAMTPWAWDVPVSATVQWDTNVENMASVYYGIGVGQDDEKSNALVSTDEYTRVGFPALEMVDALHTSVLDFGELASLTQADLDLYKTPAVKWTVGVQGSNDPRIGTFHCGDTFQVTINDHPVIPPGAYRRRITGLSGTLSDWVSIESADDYVVQNTTTSGVQTIVND